MSEIETSEERPLGDIQKDRNPGDIQLDPGHWVDDFDEIKEDDEGDDEG
jgi:hypothetical protein